MLKLLERNVDSVERRLVVLRPANGHRFDGHCHRSRRIAIGTPTFWRNSSDFVARGIPHDGAIRPDQLSPTAGTRRRTTTKLAPGHAERAESGERLRLVSRAREDRPTVDQLRAA